MTLKGLSIYMNTPSSALDEVSYKNRECMTKSTTKKKKKLKKETWHLEVSMISLRCKYDIKEIILHIKKKNIMNI